MPKSQFLELRSTMPSEMNPLGSSPSSFFPESRFSDESQTGSWKMSQLPGYYDGTIRPTNVTASALDGRFPPDSHMEKSFDLPNYYLSRGRNINLSSGKQFLGAEGASRSLPSAVDHNLGARVHLNTDPAPYFLDGDKINIIGAQHENSLFSSSMSDLFTRKLKLPSNNDVYGQSVGAVASHYEEEEAFESLEELEAQTIGNLLPDDDDLLSGVTDGFHGSMRSNNGEDVEDIDLFSSVGGLELGEDGSSQRNSELSGMNLASELGVYGGEPSRTLFVRNINSNIEDSEICTLFEQYGDIRTLYTACKNRGFIMVSYYDIRAACKAMKALQDKPLRRRKLDIHFSIPKDNPSEKDINQGSLLVFNLDSSVSNDQLREIFGVYGAIKEIRDTPLRNHPKFVEFYDVRAAESALRSLNWSEIAGKQIKLEPGLSGGSRSLMQTLSSELEQEESGLPVQHRGSPSNLATGFSAFGSSGNGSCPTPGRHYLWSNPNHSQPQATMWPNSPSFVSGMSAAHSQQLHAVPRAQTHMMNPLLNNHHVGSAPSVNASLWDRRNTYAAESPDATLFHPGSLGNMRISGNSSQWDRRNTYATESPDTTLFHPSSLGNMRMSGNSPHPLEFVPHGIFPRTAGNGMDVAIPSRNIGLHPHHQRLMVYPTRSQMVPMMSSSFDSPNERTRSRRNEGSTSHSDNKKQFELDVDRILLGDDKRTTLMIKNIPNKYTSKMLLAAIDERHRGTYDFIYLPIDFKNKCNVGYAFINMTEPSQIVPFYQTFNGKKWEKFNSEKVATLAYARIQGKSALIAHFQNSSLMNEDKRCRPILFHTDGPNAGDQVPFPMGSNIRPRSGKNRASTTEENNQELPTNSVNEDYSNGDSSSGSGKDSD